MSVRSLIESEKKLFKCILTNPKLLYEVDKDWFIDNESKIIYDSIKKLQDEKKELSLDNLFIVSNNDSIKILLEEEIMPTEADINNFQLYVNRIKEEFVKENISSLINDELNLVVNQKGDLNVETCEKISTNLRSNLDLLNKTNSLDRFSVIGRRYRQELVNRKEGNFYSYGDSSLDRITNGAIPGEITTLFAVSSMGKSAYAINLFNKQINKRIPTVYLTIEMSEISTMDRLVALRTKIPVSSLMMRTFEDIDVEAKEEVIKRYDEEYEKLKRLEDRFYILDKPGIRLNQLENEIARIKEIMGVDYLICIVDLFTMISDVGTEAKDIEKAINRQSDIAKRQNIHFINIVQANRQSDDKPITAPEQIDSLRIKSFNKIRGCGEIASRSRTVLTVFRPKHYFELYFHDQAEDIDDILEVTVLKCSQGKIGQTVKYIYEPEIFRVSKLLED